MNMFLFLKDDYQCVVCTNDIYKMIETNESSDEFSEACKAGTEVYKIVYIL